MRSRKTFSFNEEKDAEWVIINGFPNDTLDYNTMYLVAKYFRKNFGYGAIRLEEELIKFCKLIDYNFNPVVEAEIIKKWVNSAMNYDLRKIKQIRITQKEIEFIKRIENPKERKILFITLALSKALKQGSIRKDKSKIKTSDKYYIRYNNFSDIIKLSEIKNSSDIEIARILHKYKEHFIFYSPEKQLIRLNYVDPVISHTDETLDPSKMIEYYNSKFGKLSSICSVCGNAFEKKSNRQKACSECSNELNRQRVTKFREKNKLCND